MEIVLERRARRLGLPGTAPGQDQPGQDAEAAHIRHLSVGFLQADLPQNQTSFVDLKRRQPTPRAPYSWGCPARTQASYGSLTSIDKFRQQIWRFFAARKPRSAGLQPFADAPKVNQLDCRAYPRNSTQSSNFSIWT